MVTYGTRAAERVKTKTTGKIRNKTKEGEKIAIRTGLVIRTEVAGSTTM